MLVQGFDHFVVPVNDIVVAEDFYAQVFGGKIDKRVGLNVRSQSLGPHTFITIAGKRIGLITNPSGVTADGVPSWNALAGVSETRLVRLFGPEHGVDGGAIYMEAVGDAVHSPTGLPAASLYGSTRESLKPRRKDLEDLDALVFDVPDVGGVGVLRDHQEVGRTGRSGKLLVPDLLPYYGNVMGINDADVPMDRAIDSVESVVAPPVRGCGP